MAYNNTDDEILNFKKSEEIVDVSFTPSNSFVTLKLSIKNGITSLTKEQHTEPIQPAVRMATQHRDRHSLEDSTEA